MILRTLVPALNKSKQFPTTSDDRFDDRPDDNMLLIVDLLVKPQNELRNNNEKPTNSLWQSSHTRAAVATWNTAGIRSADHPATRESVTVGLCLTSLSKVMCRTGPSARNMKRQQNSDDGQCKTLYYVETRIFTARYMLKPEINDPHTPLQSHGREKSPGSLRHSNRYLRLDRCDTRPPYMR